MALAITAVSSLETKDHCILDRKVIDIANALDVGTSEYCELLDRDPEHVAARLLGYAAGL